MQSLEKLREEIDRIDDEILGQLIKRKNIVKVETKKIKRAELTELGKGLNASGIKFEETYDRLTPSMVRDGSWANKKFRR